MNNQDQSNQINAFTGRSRVPTPEWLAEYAKRAKKVLSGELTAKQAWSGMENLNK